MCVYMGMLCMHHGRVHAHVHAHMHAHTHAYTGEAALVSPPEEDLPKEEPTLGEAAAPDGTPHSAAIVNGTAAILRADGSAVAADGVAIDGVAVDGVTGERSGSTRYSALAARAADGRMDGVAEGTGYRAPPRAEPPPGPQAEGAGYRVPQQQEGARVAPRSAAPPVPMMHNVYGTLPSPSVSQPLGSPKPRGEGLLRAVCATASVPPLKRVSLAEILIDKLGDQTGALTLGALAHDCNCPLLSPPPPPPLSARSLAVKSRGERQLDLTWA